MFLANHFINIFRRKGGGGGGHASGEGDSSGGHGSSDSGSSSDSSPAESKGAPASFSHSSSAHSFSASKGRTAQAYSDGGGKSFVETSGPFVGRQAGGGTRVCIAHSKSKQGMAEVSSFLFCRALYMELRLSGADILTAIMVITSTEGRSHTFSILCLWSIITMALTRSVFACKPVQKMKKLMLTTFSPSSTQMCRAQTVPVGISPTPSYNLRTTPPA